MYQGTSAFNFASVTAVLWLAVSACAVSAEDEAKAPSHSKPLIVGSKGFPESDILAEIVTQLGAARGVNVRHHSKGPTPIVWRALLAGEVDVYPEYTGTLAKEILQDDALRDRDSLAQALRQQGVLMSPPLGFANPYGIGMLRARAKALGISKISDLTDHPQLKFTFSTEFTNRNDGWPGLRQAYGLKQTSPRLAEHGLCYAAVAAGDADATDVYLTDASIQQHDLVVLEDDLNYFPPYEAVLLYRADVDERFPEFADVLSELEGKISTAEMQALNAEVQIERRSAGFAAAGYLERELGIANTRVEVSLWRRLLRYTGQHLLLVAIAILAGIAVAVPLGVIAAKRKRVEHAILSTAEIIQTIPGLAMLALLMPVVREIGLRGTGPAPVIVALFLYSLLPIIRNTFTGMKDIPHSLRESAQVLGLTPAAILWQIELPLASRMILAGIKTTAVMMVGYATLGGLIGAGGFGEPINAGLSKFDVRLMLEGAIPAALLALAVRAVFEVAERFLVPAGLRVQAQS